MEEVEKLYDVLINTRAGIPYVKHLASRRQHSYMDVEPLSEGGGEVRSLITSSWGG